MSYRREVENLLGEEGMTKLLNHVRGGKMSDDQMKEFVLQLGSSEDPNILFGNHRRRMSPDRKLDTEILEVMNDWWGSSLYQMTPGEALETLTKALSHPDVGCKALASGLGAKKSGPSEDLQPLLDPFGTILKNQVSSSLLYIERCVF